MAFTATVYRILIASPGDVPREREVIADVINNWNHLHAQTASAVVIPLRWETDASPQLGNRPQAIINKQIVEDCDAAIAVFWTRIGSPTGKAISGTVEEIQQLVKNGKPVMVYRSKRKVTPGATNNSQYRKLDKFMRELRPNGLIDEFASTAELRQKLTNHLDMQITRLLVAGNASPKGGGAAQSKAEGIVNALAILQDVWTMLHAIMDAEPSKLDAFEPLIHHYLGRLRRMERGSICLPDAVESEILSLKDDLCEIKSLAPVSAAGPDKTKAEKELRDTVRRLSDWTHEKMWDVVVLSRDLRASQEQDGA